MSAQKIGILVFDKIEVLDFVGPYEVFTAVRLDESKRWETKPPFDVYLVAEKIEPVASHNGMQVIPDMTLEQCPPLDLLLVPGGWGTRIEFNNERLIAWIAERGRSAGTLASVCTGARLLAKAGLLDGRHATTHWNSLGWLAENFPHVKVETTQHVVEDGNVITSAGISAGIDLALRLVARYCGDDVALATARYMEYRYPNDNTRRV